MAPCYVVLYNSGSFRGCDIEVYVLGLVTLVADYSVAHSIERDKHYVLSAIGTTVLAGAMMAISRKTDPWSVLPHYNK